MSEGAKPGATGAGPFEGIDPRLNVFALANGMDLTKGPGFRRLEWFTEGMERGILIEPDGAGGFRAEVQSWPTGSRDVSGRASIGEGLSVVELNRLLPSAIDTANGL